MRISLHFLRVGAPLLIAAACIAGIWESWRFLQADQFYWQGSADSIRAAIHLEPDCWLCYTQLARLDDKDAEELLRTSLRLNAYNSDAAIDLGLRYEADGDISRAEQILLQAFAVDNTYAPRWTLANFYFRQDKFSAFWLWARRAAEMPADDIGALFDLCWRVSPDPKTIEATIVGNDPSVLRQYVDFLVGMDRKQSAVHPALRLMRVGSVNADRDRLFALIDSMIAANDAESAHSLWMELIRRHWIMADSSFPNNPEFARAPLPVKFDWNLGEGVGLHSWPGSSGLVTEFSGDESENCNIAEQSISLPPGNYLLESSYRTQGIAANSGIRWEIANEESDTPLAISSSMASDTVAKVTLPLSVGPNERLLRLRLVYHRQLGSPRVSGTLVIPSIGVRALPAV